MAIILIFDMGFRYSYTNLWSTNTKIIPHVERTVPRSRRKESRPMPIDTTAFRPGTYWTKDRAVAAAAAMAAEFGSPTMQAAMQEASQTDTAEEFVAAGGDVSASRKTPLNLRGRDILVRRGLPPDVPHMARLILAGNLPPLFIEPFLGGFAVAVAGDDVVACGGLEMYEDSGVIRSVVVDEAARGLGLGRLIAELLIEDAKRSGAADCYLFTAEAHDFWLRLGFKDMPLDKWREPPRQCWQYLFISQHIHEMPVQVFPMWKAL
jgi:amino-acid N-acetyltransferase